VGAALALAVSLSLASCSNGSSGSNLPSPPSSVPVVTPNPSNSAFATLCADVGQVEHIATGMLSGAIPPTQGIQEVQGLSARFRADAETLRQSQPEVATVLDDLANAVDQLRTALAAGGSVVAALRDAITRIETDVSKLPQSLCGTSPSPAPS
jgi:hypothetical protein